MSVSRWSGTVLRGCLLATLSVGTMMGALWVAPSVAQAQDLSEEDQTKIIKLLEEGNKLFNNGGYAEALEKYEQAVRIADLAQIRYRMGLCYDRLEQYDKAITNYERYIKLKPDAENKGRIEADIQRLKQKAAQASQARLDIRTDPAGFEVRVGGKKGQLLGKTPLNISRSIGTVTLYIAKDGYSAITKKVQLKSGDNLQLNFSPQKIQPGRSFLRVETTPPGATVKDMSDGGKVLGKTPFVAETAPGKHTLSITRKGSKARTEEVTLNEGETSDVSFKLTPDGTESTGGTSTATAGWVLTGTGIALGVGAGVLWYLTGDSIQQYNDLDGTDASNTRADLDALDSDISTYKLGTYITGGLAGASILTGIILIAIDDDKAEEAVSDSSSFHVSPLPGGGHVTFSIPLP